MRTATPSPPITSPAAEFTNTHVGAVIASMQKHTRTSHTTSDTHQTHTHTTVTPTFCVCLTGPHSTTHRRPLPRTLVSITKRTALGTHVPHMGKIAMTTKRALRVSIDTKCRVCHVNTHHASRTHGQMGAHAWLWNERAEWRQQRGEHARQGEQAWHGMRLRRSAFRRRRSLYRIPATVPRKCT